ncbi:hypothetical protein [Legionella jamestowniensis]|uniref:Uncharacterized protein n=1 Tax=Legionella jamestowniensis TaxID=455 RepID=A0A0W0UK79_9GAMM|nr:hypothetical protein [Legionella jamestowniensis]KTD08322.1 hypothetical protein Ljam_2517 [Legionella jamestowniensis]OCH97152.1 hypothetical protein A8135_05870 [Legionella jamestowniensis]SFL49734.1 hypothetical protein SAMN02746073_0454 [Legionella jamestowniensis DSM 19215]
MKLVNLFRYVFAGKGIIDVSNIDSTNVERIKQRIEKRSTEIKNEFEFILKDENLSNPFRTMLLQLNTPNALSLEKILFDSKEVQTSSIPEKFIMPAEEKLQEVFKEKNSIYGYFRADDLEAFQQFSLVYKFIQLASNYINCDNSEQTELYECAYKTLVCFGNLKDQTELKMLERIEQFLLTKQASQAANKSIPTLMDLQIGKKNGINFDEWSQFIKKYGVKTLTFFARAQDIEEKLKRVPQTPAEAFNALAQTDYKRYWEDPELAKVCEQYNVPETVFNRCLDLEVNKLWKTKDNLPNITVNGSDPEINKSGYYLVKLPIKDPRSLILGYITNDCQSIGSKGELCVLDGISSEHNGFYVMLKKKESKKDVSPFLQDKSIDYENFEIVGQGYAWLSMSGNLTIDSWENARQKDDQTAVAMLKKFSQMVISQSNGNIVQVTTGRDSPRTPSAFSKALSLKYAEIMEEGTQYNDSKSQTLIAIDREKIKDIKDELIFQLTENEDFTPTRTLKDLIEPIYSQKHSMWIWSLLATSKSLDWHSEDTLTAISSCVNLDYSGGVVTWKALFLMEQASLLNNDSFQHITADKWQAKTVCETIIALGNAQLLDQKNFAVLIKINNDDQLLNKDKVLANISRSSTQLSRANIHLDNNSFEALANACVLAEKSGKNFNEGTIATVITLKTKFGITLDGPTFSKLLENGRYAPEILNLFTRAKEYRLNVLDNAVYKNIIANAPYLKALNKVIPSLATVNILDNAIFQSLIKNVQDSPYMPYVISLLHEHDLLDKENFNQLMQHASYAEDIYDVLAQLGPSILDREKVQFIFEHHENAYYLGKILAKLSEANLLDNDSFNKLKPCVSSLEEVSKIISLLEKYELLNKDNFLLVVENHSAAKDILEALKKLKESNTLNDSNFKEELTKNTPNNGATLKQEGGVFPSTSTKEALQKLKNPADISAAPATNIKVM